MLQEYLFTKEEFKEEISKIEIPKDVKWDIIDVDKNGCWILQYSIKGNNVDAAKTLSELNIEIINKYRPSVIANECSAYFHKTLFPIINEFERKLRKLLYSSSALGEKDPSTPVIENLEKMDLGEIFTMLFIDTEFVKTVKTRVNDKSGSYTKREILSSIENYTEDTVWDKLVGRQCVETLRDRFYEAKDYRNDVMHAHNMDYNQFESAKNLFKEINKEMDFAIEELIGNTDKEDVSSNIDTQDFNRIIGNAIENMRDVMGMSSLTDTINNMSSLSNYGFGENKRWENVFTQLGELALGRYKLKPELENALSNLGKFALLQEEVAPASEALSKLSRELKTSDIAIPPAVTEFQKKLSDIDFGTFINKKSKEE